MKMANEDIIEQQFRSDTLCEYEWPEKVMNFREKTKIDYRRRTNILFLEFRVVSDGLFKSSFVILLISLASNVNTLRFNAVT